MALNIENNQNTVRNTNENTVMISQNMAQTQPSDGFKEVDYLDTLDSVYRTSYDRFRSIVAVVVAALLIQELKEVFLTKLLNV